MSVQSVSSFEAPFRQGAVPSPWSEADEPVIACIDDGGDSRAVARLAAIYARSFGRPLVLRHLLDHNADPARIPDPFEWSLRRHEALRKLERLRAGLGDIAPDILLEVQDGDPGGFHDSLGSGAHTLLVVGAPRARGARTVAAQVGRLLAVLSSGSVLMVPAHCVGIDAPPRRIAVPVDGSNHAEAALAEAGRLARRLHAEVLLVHVVPEAGLAAFGPPDTSDLELRLAVDRRNEQAACGFLELSRRRLADQGLSARSLCLRGDVRETLLRALSEAAPDLIVLSPNGQGRRRCSDLPVGSTASYLLDHLDRPVMVVKSERSAGLGQGPMMFRKRSPGQARVA